MQGISRARQTVDIVLAAVFALLGLPFAFGTVGALGEPWTVVLVLFAFSAALALRRRNAGLALAIGWGAALVQMCTLSEVHWADAAVLGILYSTAAHGGRTVRWLGLVSAAVGAFVATTYLMWLRPVLLGHDPALGGPAEFVIVVIVFVGILSLLVLSWVTGLLVRTVRQHRDTARREEIAKRERELVEYRYAVEQERNRIARDMHDVVAHSLAVVIAQSDGARFAAATQPERAVEALGTIAQVARGALGDVRLLLAELRHDEGSAPQPALDDLADLVERMRGAGLDIGFAETGERRPLGTGHQIALFRIAQESLTNALRHGVPGSPVSLELVWDDAGAVLTTANRMPDGPAPRATPYHHGIPGMRERAVLAGGSLSAEPDGAGRFVVRAVIPAQAGARRAAAAGGAPS
ncbi:sensor histidine kinase [Agromyces seonyuensis]|uniref:histidine kinase n=1 Tax=Agromyces seonyuensis TaxID=2662446 RepID=A0A6I4P1H5_9MICO|nr:histidine kinase [Agromyces seonyuensis]MWC00232.1 sensor histidine kinase [Agromyces seonyuensis]